MEIKIDERRPCKLNRLVGFFVWNSINRSAKIEFDNGISRDCTVKGFQLFDSKVAFCILKRKLPNEKDDLQERS
jgi:hypothetical protein